MGFKSDREFAVYKTLEYTLDDAKGITGQIFDRIEEELSITDWQAKGEVKKSMRKNIKDVLRGKMDSNDIQPITVSLVDLIKRN